MHIYYQIFYNSFQSVIILSLHPEIDWFAALGFGAPNMALATLAAIAGSSAGMGVNFALGYYAAKWRNQWVEFSDETYTRIAGVVQRYACHILLFSFLPLMGVITVIVGIFRVHPARALALIITGRVAYYSYYLLHL